MHQSLQIKTNVLLAAGWGVAAAGLTLVVSPRPWALVAIAAALGIAAGYIQGRSIHLSTGAFRNAGTLLEVRKALSSTPGGKLYIFLFWCAQSLLAALALWQYGSNMLLAFLAAYSSFAVCREAVSLPAIVALNREQACHTPGWLQNTNGHVNCATHGKRLRTRVCQHIVQSLHTNGAVGFHWSEDDSGSHPDAWCSDCDAVMPFGDIEWSQGLKDKVGISDLCSSCYERAKDIWRLAVERTPS